MSDTDLAFRATLDGSGFASGAQTINGHLRDMGVNTGTATASLGPLGTILGTMANPMTAVALGITALGAAFVGSVQNAAAFESAMSGAKKVISLDAGVDSDAYFTKLGSDLQELSTRAPVAATDLAALAAVGGSLGVASGEIAGFAESAAQMSVAFEMPAEAAATAAAKILNSFQMPISTENMQALGNVVNQIGDSMAATEPEVLDFVNRASFLNTTMGLSIPQVATLGGVLISAGMSAETASGGIKSMMNTLTSETSKTGGLDNWAKLMGVSVDELKGKVAGDLPNTLIDTANKIAAIEDPVQRFQTAVALAGSEGAPALLKLAGATDTYNSALAQSISQWESGKAGTGGGMAKTFEQNSSTFSAQATMLGNAMTYASTAVGNIFLPSLTAGAGALTSFVVGAVHAGQALAGIVSGSATFASISAAATAMGSAVGAVFSNMTAVIGPVWASLGSGTSAMGALGAAFDLVTTPIRLVADTIGLVATGFGAAESAMQPFASVLGGTLGSGITTFNTGISTAKAYLSAFASSISEVVTQSSAFQAFSSAFETAKSTVMTVIDDIKAGIEGMVKWVEDELAKLDPGKALGGAVGGITDSVTGTLSSIPGAGGLLDFLGGVSNKAEGTLVMEDAARAQAKAASDAAADEIAKNGKLKKAGAEALETDEAKAAMKNAGASNGADAGEEAAKAYADGIKKWVEQNGSQFEAGMTLINGAWVSNQESITGSPTTVGKTSIGGFDFVLDEKNYLSLPNGTKEFFANSADLHDRLFAYMQDYIGRALTPLEQAEIMGDVDTQVKLKAQVDLKPLFEVKLDKGTLGSDEAFLLEGALENYARYTRTHMGEEAAKTAEEYAQKFADGLAAQDWKDFADMTGYRDAMEQATPWNAEQIERDYQKYKTALLSQITDMKAYTKDLYTDLGKSITDSLADSIISEDDLKLYKAMVPKMEAIKEKSPEAFGEAGLESILQFAKMAEDGATTAELVAYYKGMGLDAGTAFTDSLYGTLRDVKLPKLSDLLNNPDLQKTITDMPDFLENTFQPALKRSFEDQYAISKQSYGNSLELTKAWIADTEKAYSEHSSWFNNWQGQLLQMYKNNQIAADDLMWVWDQMESNSAKADKATEKLKDQTVGYDNLKKSIQDCADCAISEFGQWQESQDNLFQDSYIGPGGQSYLDWKTKQIQDIAETQRAMKAVGGAVVGQDYTNSPLLENQIKITADSSAADATKAELLSSIQNANPIMTMQLESSAAMAEVNQLLTYIITANPVMSVQVQISAYADEIAAMVESQVRAALA